MKRQLSILFLLFIFIVHGVPVAAQLYFKARTITVDEGLSDKRVTCFFKDSRGFMWIGTRNGLNRYDGHSFRIFRPAQANSISNEVINDIAEDRDGRIWVATMEGLNYYDPVKDHWECLVPDPDTDGGEIPNYIVWDIWFDKNDLLWIASDVFEFCSYNYRSKEFTYYDWPGFARAHLNSEGLGKYNSIQKFLPRNDHSFWLATTKGLVSLDIQTRQFNLVGADYYASVIDLKYDSEHRKVFLSSEKGRLFQFDEQANKYTELFAQQESYPSTRFSHAPKHEIWLASDRGLYKINEDRSAVHLAGHIPQLSGSLLLGGVNAVYEDNEHIRWVGTANGISAYDPSARSSSFLPLIPASDRESSNRMTGVYFDAISNRYFAGASDPACVFVVDVGSGAITKIARDAKGDTLSACRAILPDRDKNIWLLTESNVYRYDRLSGQFILFPTPNKKEKAAFRSMIQDDDGNYWFSTFNEGLFYYKVSERRFVPLQDTNAQYLSATTGLASDPAHRQVLIGTFGEGTFTYHLDKKLLTGYYETREVRDYSQLVLVHDIEMDAGGRAWVSTHSGGVFRYNYGAPYNEAFTRFDMKKGLSNNNILSLCTDGDSTIWLLSGNGISAIDTSGRFLYNVNDDHTFSFSVYSSDNMVPHDMYFDHQKNELIAGVGGGLFFYSPKAATVRLSFPVVITGIRIDNQEVNATTWMTGSSLHRIPYHSNSVSFAFAGLYYGSIQGVTYEYTLEGYDNKWMSSAKEYTAVYQNLPSGNYTFRVRAKDHHGNIAGQVNGVSFRIVPPFWQTWWFKVLLVIIIALAIWWFIYSLRQKLQAEKQLNSFATSLYGQNTIDDIFWDTARNCVQKLGFLDCVIYQHEQERGTLIQRAAFGPKNPHRREILNVIELQVGKGIVGSVAKTGKAEIIGNTARDTRYIVDDEKRLSEITVPIWVDGKVFAVIDSEHPKKYFYKRHHLRLLKKIAEICSERILKYLTEERLRAKIARDLHDEMGSTLTSINIISKVAMQGDLQDEQVKHYLQKIKDNSGRMMESMSDIVWAINPANDSFEKVILRMKEFAAEILEPARINYYFREEGLLDKAQLNLEQRKDIYMIFKEAINNAVKYSGATEINIILQKNNDLLKMIITDNGNGFDTGHVHSGNGLKNMKTRAREMRAELRIDSIRNTGTTISLEVPVT